MIGAVAFVLGLALAIYGEYKIDSYDDRMGIRPGASIDGYGSNISYVWPYTHFCQIGFLIALLSPVIGLLAHY